MLVIIMVHVSSFFEQGRVAMDEIYGDDSLLRRRKTSCILLAVLAATRRAPSPCYPFARREGMR